MPKIVKNTTNKDFHGPFRIFARWLLLTFISLRLFLIFAEWRSFAGGDTIGYRPLVPQPPALNFFKYWPQVLTGGSFRSILPVGFFHLFQTDDTRMIAQSIVSLVCWSFLITSVSKWASGLDTPAWSKVTLPLVIAVIGLSSEITEWNKLIYSESLAFSVMCIIFGMLLKTLSVRKKITVVDSLIYTFWLFMMVTTRPNLLAFGLFFSLALCIYAFRLKNMKKANLVAIIAILIFSNFANVFYLDLQGRTWTKSISREFTTISYYASQDNQNAASFIQVLNSDRTRPACIAPLTAPLVSGQEMVWGANLSPLGKSYCPAAVKWAKESVVRLIVTWAAQNPKAALGTYRTAFIASTRSQDVFGYITPLPAPLIEMIYPQTANDIELWSDLERGPGKEPLRSFDPIFLYIPILLMTPIVLRRRSSKTSKIIETILRDLFHNSYFALMIFLGTLGSLLSGIATIPGPQGEVYRMGIIPWTVLRAMIVMSFVLQIPKYFELIRNSKS